MVVVCMVVFRTKRTVGARETFGRGAYLDEQASAGFFVTFSEKSVRRVGGRTGGEERSCFSSGAKFFF